MPRSRQGPRSPPLKPGAISRPPPPGQPSQSGQMHSKSRNHAHPSSSTSSGRMRPISPPSTRPDDKQSKLPPIKHRVEEKVCCNFNQFFFSYEAFFLRSSILQRKLHEPEIVYPHVILSKKIMLTPQLSDHRPDHVLMFQKIQD